jgi:integrase
MLVTKIGSELWCYTHALTPSRSCLHPATSLADARTKRDNAKKLLAEGIAPSVERKQERRNARMARANTFEAVAKELMDKSEAEGDAPKTLKKKQWLLDFANKEFGKRPIAEIKAPEILDALRKIEKRGRHETATRARGTIGAVFRFAIATGRAERDPTADLRGALITPTVTHRATIVEPKAVGALLRAIGGFEGHAVT